MLINKSYIDGNGRLAISARLRKQLNLKKGDQVTTKITDEGLLISSFQNNLAKVRQLIKHHIGDKSLVDELISMRREEAAKEEAEFADYKTNKNPANESQQ